LTIYTKKIVVEKSQQHHQNNMEMGDEIKFGDDDQHFEMTCEFGENFITTSLIHKVSLCIQTLFKRK
jgi:hypothetical protein